MFSALYKISSRILSTRVPAYLEARIAEGKEDPARIDERYGIASHPRPEGPLLWIHAASVGESRSILALIHGLLEKHLDWHVLVTTGTVSSARIISAELPAHAIHQFLPLDVPKWVSAFLDHWKPDCVVWVEQEIWPNMLSQIHERGIAAILANGRMEESSFKRWQWIQSFARNLLQPFTKIYAQSQYDGERFARLSGREVLVKGNLKYAAEPLPYNPVVLDRLKKEIGDRPVWLAASTHLGEEEILSKAHQLIRAQRPEALLILVPRHPDRRDQIMEDLHNDGLAVAMRSIDEPILKESQVYLADTLGETGLFFRLSPIVFMGGTLVPIGGHNLVEPAQLDCAILYGPYMENNREIKEQFEASGASFCVSSAEELANAVLALMASMEARDKMSKAASELITKEGAVLQDLIADVEQVMGDV